MDLLRGAKVRKHFDAIKKINEDHESNYAILERKGYLLDILAHCKNTVPYYKNLEIANILLDQFPVVDKNLIRSNYDSFCSQIYPKEKMLKATTSGSTGTPFIVFYDSNKKRRHTADTLYYGESVNHELGTKVFYLKIWNEQNSKGKLIQKMQNIVPINVFKLDDEKIHWLLESIKFDGSPKSILGYASALDCIVKYLDRNPTEMSHYNVISIIAMSESLDEHTKKSLKKYFECPVVSRYANLENGILAQQTLDLESEFLINFASYHIEILDIRADVPVNDGEIGRIVVTDMFNRAMPLIRYDTGDLGAMGKFKKNGKVLHVLKKVEGRKMDAIYDTQGELLSSFTIVGGMWKYNELNQYKFTQVSKKEYEFELNSVKNFDREDELILEFKNYLGQDAEISVNYVNEIPLLSSGKRKKVVSMLT